MLLDAAPSYASMTSAEVDAALVEVEPLIDLMLSNTVLVRYYLKITWWMWSGCVLYAYVVSHLFLGRSTLSSDLTFPPCDCHAQIFVAVAIQYFGYIKRSMAKVTTLDTHDQGRQLRLAWLFATLTSALVTTLGIVYFGTSFAVAVWTMEILANAYALAVVTLISL